MTNKLLIIFASCCALSSCNVSQEKGALLGTGAGAAAGAALGNVVSNGDTKTTILGGLAGAAIGNQVGKGMSDPEIVTVRRGDQ